jgi:hypothetical protein
MDKSSKMDNLHLNLCSIQNYFTGLRVFKSLISDINSALLSLHPLHVGSVAEVSRAYAAYFFTVELFSVGEFPCKYRVHRSSPNLHTTTMKMEAVCTSHTSASTSSHVRNVWSELLCIPIYCILYIHVYTKNLQP